jgi:hypothetical protein
MRRRIAVLITTATLTGTAIGQVELYAVDFPGNLYRVNQSTGNATLIAFTGTDRLNAAAADAGGAILASRTRNPSVGTDFNALIRIDAATGAGTTIANYGLLNDLRGLAFGAGGVLYGVRDASLSDELVRIDPGTGAVTLIGAVGRTDIQGLTATDTGELYAVGVTGTGGSLHRIDPATGLGTIVLANLNAGQDVQALEWETGTSAWVARASLRRIDLVTGTPSIIGAMGPSDVRGLAAVRPVGCYANCDGSTVPPVLNVGDFTCFLQRFAAGDSYANCDQSTIPPVLNVGDFTCFLQRFAAGCP